MKKKAAVILAVIVIISLGVGSVFAYLKWSAGAENSFTAASSKTPDITESFDSNVKTDVAVNVGDTGYSVYVRAAVVATWVNSKGDVLSQKPSAAKRDYDISLNMTDWFLGDDGYYYHKYAVNSGGSTAALIESCRPLKAAPTENGEDYTLDVKIISQTIQAAGSTDNGEISAVEDAWGVRVSDDKSLERQ